MKKKWELGADIDISKLLSNLQKAKSEAKDFDEIMADVGDYKGLKNLAEKFKGLSGIIEEMQNSVETMQAKLGKNIKGGFISGLDNVFEKMAQVSDMAKQVFAGLSNIKLTDSGASAELVRYAAQLNALFKNLGIDQSIDMALFDTMDVKTQFDTIIKYVGEFGKELKITLGSIDDASFENFGKDVINNIRQTGGQISNAIQEQINTVEQKINEFEAALSELNTVKNNVKLYNSGVNIKINFGDIKDTEKYVNDAIENYERLDKATKDIRTGKRTATPEDTKSLIDYTSSILTLEALKAEDQKGKKSKLKLTEDSEVQKRLRAVLEDDDSYLKWINFFEKKFAESAESALNKAIEKSKNKINEIKTEAAIKSQSSFATVNENKVIDKKIQQYEELLAILQEYARVLKTTGDAESEEAIAVSDKLESALERMSFSKDKKENDEIAFAMRDILGNLEYGDISAEDIPSQLATILGVEVPKAANKAESAFTNVTNELQDVENMALRIKKAFDMVHDTDVEYRISFKGQDMDIREGLAKSIDEKTIVESYLANIQKGTTVGAHSHRGISSGYSVADIREAINSQYSGINAVSAVMGDKDITTLNFAGISREIANKILAAIEKDATMLSAGELKADAINKIAQKFGAGDIAKSWDNADEFRSFAQYIYDIEKASQEAVQPVERLQNLLKYLKPDIDLSKYANDLEQFSNGSASVADVYNKIAKSEGLKTIVDNTNISTLADASERLTRQQEEYQQKLDNTKITYQEILEKVEQVKAAGAKRSTVENAFGDYFNTKDLRDVLGSFELTDNFDIANKIADKFGIDNFDGILDILKTKIAGADSSVSELQSLLSERVKLLDQVDNGGDTKNKDILRERAVNDEIREKIRLLEEANATRQSGVSSATEAENLSKANFELQEKNRLLREEAAKRQENLNKITAEKEAIERELETERYVSQAAADDAIKSQIKAEKLEEQNAELREQLELTKQIDAQQSATNNQYASPIKDRKYEIEVLKSIGVITEDMLSDEAHINSLLQERKKIWGDLCALYSPVINASNIGFYQTAGYDTWADKPWEVTSRFSEDEIEQYLLPMYRDHRAKLDKYEAETRFFPKAMDEESIEKYVHREANRDPELYALMDKWYAAGEIHTRDLLAEAINNHLGLKNAALGSMWNRYKSKTGLDISYEDFLASDIPVYRATQNTDNKNQYLSYSLSEETARKFGENVSTFFVKALDTVGSANFLRYAEEDEVIAPSKIAGDEYQNKILDENVALREQIELQKQAKVENNNTKEFYLDDEYQLPKDKIKSYEELCKVAERYKQIVTQGVTSEGLAEGDRINDLIDATRKANGFDLDMDQYYEAFNSDDTMSLEKMAQYLGIEIPQAANKAEEAIKEVKQEIELFDTPHGQLSMIEGMPEDFQKAENAAEELKDTVKEIAALDGQISFDELEADMRAAAVAADSAQNKIKINQKLAIDMAKDFYAKNGRYSEKQIDFYSEKMINKLLSNAFNQDIDGITRDPDSKLYFSHLFGDGNSPENVAKMRKEYELCDQILRQIGFHLEEWEETENIQGFSAKIVKNGEEFVVTLQEARNILMGIDSISNNIPTSSSKTVSSVVADKLGSGVSGIKILEDTYDPEKGVRKVAGAYKDVDGELKTYNLTLDKNLNIIKENMGLNDKLIKKYNKVEQVQKKVNNSAENDNKQKVKVSNNLKKQYDSITTEASKTTLVGGAKDKYQEYTDKYKKLLELEQKINASNGPINEATKKEFNALTVDVEKLTKDMSKLASSSKKLRESVGIENVERIPDDVDSLGKLEQAMKDFAQRTTEGKVKNMQFEESTRTLTYEVNKGNGAIEKMTISVDEYSNSLIRAKASGKGLTTAFGQFAKVMNQGMVNVFRYVTSFVGFYDIINKVRTGVNYIKEIDGALTELKKVTDETEASYDNFLNKMSKTADVVGSTVTNLTTMAAEWARLGYSLKEAGDLAESTAILLNVSEFNDATEASEALISTIQAFGYAANESMSVVDILNEVGNNFAVSSDGLATALQDSASALMTAGNSLEQSVALVAAANKVVQDPNSVGSALRTISLRLRGTSVEVLEEMGEETDNVVESTSKLQSKLKALTGVDILTNDGAYKDTYTILKEIAEVWNDLDNMDQAAALELMAGKNRANTLAAILTNIEDLEAAYLSAIDAEGSALKENEAYLDSIQGKIDLFTNSVQTAWSNIIGTDFIKGIIDAGRVLVETFGNLPGLIGAVSIALAAIAKIKMYDEMSIMGKWLRDAIPKVKELGSSIWELVTARSASTQGALLDALANQKVSDSLQEEILSKIVDKAVTDALTKEEVQETMATLSAAYADGTLTAAQYLQIASTLGLKEAFSALWDVLKSNPLLLIGAAAIAVAVAFDALHTTVAEAAEAANEVFEEMRSIVDETKSSIQSLESELSTLQNQIDELEGKKLSFVDEEELKRLKKQKSQLEHSLKIQEQLLESQKETKDKRAVTAMKAYTKAASEGAEESRKLGENAGWAVGIMAGLGIALMPFTGGTSLFATVAATGAGTAGAIAGTAAVAGGLGFLGSKAGEAIGSATTANDGTYDAWYQTYVDAIETAQREEQAALERYQKDTSNIDKLEAWQAAQTKITDIETEMYDHLSQMQSYYDGLEYGQSAALDQELDNYYNFLDKLNIKESEEGLDGGKDARATAIERIFGENASAEVQMFREEMENTAAIGDSVDFTEADAEILGLADTLEYLGIEVQDVENYFKDAAKTAEEAAASATDFSDAISNIAQLESGMGTLSSAMEEFSKEGSVSASTLDGMDDSFKSLGDTWEEYAKVMMSGNATTAEAYTVTQNLAKAWLDANANAITAENKWAYITQLQKAGVENAEELINSYINNDFFDSSVIGEQAIVFRKDPDAAAQNLVDLAAEQGVVLELADAYELLALKEEQRDLEKQKNNAKLVQQENEEKQRVLDEIMSLSQNTGIPAYINPAVDTDETDI